jgi:hypothetical protein
MDNEDVYILRFKGYAIWTCSGLGRRYVCWGCRLKATEILELDFYPR